MVLMAKRTVIHYKNGEKSLSCVANRYENEMGKVFLTRSADSSSRSCNRGADLHRMFRTSPDVQDLSSVPRAIV